MYLPPLFRVTLDEHLKIVDFFSTMMEETYQWEEVLGKEWQAFFADEIDFERFAKNFHELFEKELSSLKSFNYSIICKDHSSRVIDFHMQRMLKHGKSFVYLIGVENHHKTDNSYILDKLSKQV